jgi:hypothetical protein
MSVVNIRKKELNKRGIDSFADWAADVGHVYIGRNMTFYVLGTYESKWANPFSVQKYGRDKCLELYEEHIRGDKDLWGSLDELRGCELGCWCAPEACHGDILLKLLSEK